MNNYIPLNKAVGPKVICDGYRSCELETSYYNQQGEGCFLGVLQATAKLAL